MPRLPNEATTERSEPSWEELGPYARNRHGLSQKVWRLHQKLYVKAKREPKFRFYALYDRLYRADVLYDAWCQVAANDGSPGVDGVRVADLVKDPDALATMLDELGASLRAKTYRPSPVKRVYIRKANGKQRPLGVPTVRDRVVQTAALLVLEPIFEVDFQDCSFGSRPGRNAHQAVDAVKQAVSQGRHAVLDADLKSYFDTIPHDNLMKTLEQRISDGSVLRLIRQWLRAPIVEEGRPPQRPSGGTPQGGVLSPLLANAYLNWLDRQFHKADGPGRWANARLIRYADDFVICARFIDRRILGWLENLMIERLGLTLNLDKTRVIDLKQPKQAVSFLGFTIRTAPSRFGGTFAVVTPSPEAVQGAIRRLTELTDHRYGLVPIPQLIGRVNRYLRGWGAYFNHGYASRGLSKVQWHATQRLTRHLKRRGQRSYRPPKNVTWYQHLHRDLGLVRLTVGRR